MKKYYVYEWFIIETGEIFHIGMVVIFKRVFNNIDQKLLESVETKADEFKPVD